MKYLSAAAITLVAYASPANATTEDMLAAALKRIEALESKTDRLAEENKQLRSQLHKTSETAPKEQVKYIYTKTAVSAPASTVPNALPSIPVYQAQEQGSNWQGIYAGINFGYGKNNVPINRRSVGSGYYSNDSNTTYGEGPLAGGQIGFSYQFSNDIVLGGEADFDWANVVLTNYTANGDYNSGGNYGNNSSIYTSSYNSRYGLDWLGTARARLGYSFANLMPYITGGLAYGQLSSYENRWFNNAFSGSPSSTASNFQSGNASKTNFGWTAGAGVEYLLPNHWSIKAEYLYSYLGSLTRYDQTFSSNSYPNSGSYYSSATLNNFGIHQARVGLNYHTDWLASKPAVSAKY